MDRILSGAAFFLCVSLLCPDGRNSGTAADIQSSPLLFYHESSEEPRLAALLKKFDYDEYVSSGMTEFEQMALLKNWVYLNIPYGLNYNDTELRDAVKIIIRARKGDSFICTNLSAVFLECAVSLGWTSRHVFLRKPTREEHAGNDIWSNQYRKWIFIDPTWNIHIERSGVPLSIPEIRREWIRNRGKSLVYVFGAGSNMRRHPARELPVIRDDSRVWSLIPIDRSWLRYMYEIAVVGRNDFFSCPGGNGSNLWDSLYLIRDRVNRKDRTWPFLGTGKPATLKALFHDLNRIDIKIPHYKKGFHAGPIGVRLNAFGDHNYTPNFMEYLVKINNEDWKVVSDRFRWDLTPGINIIRARIMNRFGVVGPVFVKRIVVPGKKKKG